MRGPPAVLFVLAAYQSDLVLAAYQYSSLVRRLPVALPVSQEAACRSVACEEVACRSVAPGRRRVASMAVLAAAPTIKAPRGATRIFTRRVASALVSVISVVTLILTAAERWPIYDSLYFTTTTLATIGFGDIRPITKVGRAVTSLLGVSGVGLLGGLVSAVVGEWEQSSAEESQLRLEEEPPVSAASRWAWMQPWEKGWAWVRASRPGLFAALELVRVSGLLLTVGTMGFKLCEPGRSWLEAAYLVVGVMSTAGLGDVVTRTLPYYPLTISPSHHLTILPSCHLIILPAFHASYYPTKVPRTAASKLFLAAYAPLAVLLFARVVGALALLPLEAAKVQAQRAVLSRYAEGLTAETLDEIARGPVVTRLGLSADDSCCTRDEFTLLTLVLQGKVSEADLAECRAAFNMLDVRQLGRVSIEDLELARQPRLLRVAPRLRQRRLRRLRKSFGEALNTTKTAVVRASNKGLSRPGFNAERMEDWFPHWKTGRKGRDAEEGGDGGSGAE